MKHTFSQTVYKYIKSLSCRQHLNNTDEVQGDSFIKVTVGSVEGQNLHNLLNKKQKRKTNRKLSLVQVLVFFLLL